ncbi:MAG TPA: 2Fe-2S iron-sulfur cluster-binding protein [Planctomycetaceae bacterium]|nr:2Fe-2S iron-sulfur cluster-binding protein [Planctomycetaceae bacterium]
MPKITFVNEKKTIEVPEGANLREEALKAGVNVYQGVSKVLHCPGFGMCTTCKVNVRKGAENLSPPSRWERANMGNPLLHPLTFFSRIGREKTLRLACQARVHGDVEVETHPPFNWHGEKFWS